MVTIPGMFEENTQFEMTPGDNDHWNIRILEGEYVESVIKFGKIKVGEDDMLHFNFTLVSTPHEGLSVDDNDFQRYAGKILESIMMTNLKDMEKSE